MTGRPRNERPSKRMTVTVPADDFDLLDSFALQEGKSPPTIAFHFINHVLRGARTDDGKPNLARIEANLRMLRGDQDLNLLPRWHWRLDVLLADIDYWNRWYPELCKLLGRGEFAGEIAAYDERPSLVVNRHGYFDLLEWLFPTVTGPRGAITWRSLDYPGAAEGRWPAEDGRPRAPVWEAVIRHTVLALEALAESDTPGDLLLTEDQLRHGWRDTLRALLGEPQDNLPRQRLT
jgi:hypothetical protein